MKLKTIFKNIVVLSICLAMVLSVSMPSAFAASYENSGKVRIEAEGNDVYADHQGGNVVIIENDTSASGGQTVRTDMDNWSWKFTPSVTATYTFEMFGTGGGGGANSYFSVGDTKIYTGEILGATDGSSWGITDGQTTKLGSIDLVAGKTYTLAVYFDGNSTRKLDYIDAYYTVLDKPETDIFINAVEDFDRVAGPGVAWYDNSSTSYADSNCIEDPDFIDIQNASGGWNVKVFYMQNKDWFKYWVDIPSSGYYRVLVSLKGMSSDCDASVTVNDTQYADFDIYRATENMSNWIGAVKPWDNAGLFWFDKGINTVKFAQETSDGSMQFYALRIVSPDMGIYTVGDSAQKFYIEDCGEGNYKGTLADKKGVPSVNMAGPKKDGYNYATWTYNFPESGVYRFYLNMVDGYYPNKGHIEIDGTAVTDTVTYTSGSYTRVDLGTANVSAGSHTVTYAHDSYGNQTYVTGITVVKENTDVEVAKVDAGTYKAIADVTDFYAGVTHNSASEAKEEYKPLWKPWYATAEGDATINNICLIAAVYKGDEVVNAYVSNTVNEATNAVNANLKDYTITVNDIAVGEGETVKLLLWDATDSKPLTDFIEYK